MSSAFLKRAARPRRSRQLSAGLGSLLLASYANPAAAQEPELEVRVSSARRAERSPTGEGIDAQQARRVAGAGGDVVRGAESLAGVGRSSFGSGQWSLWGSDAASTRYYVDGISVPFLLYQGGLRSWIDADGVGQVILEPGAARAQVSFRSARGGATPNG